MKRSCFLARCAAVLRKSLVCVAIGLAPQLTAYAQGFDRQSFDAWVNMRTGAGEPVYWYSSGTLRSIPDGRLLAHLEGYDTARMVPDAVNPKDKALQLSRKIYIYRDPETGAVMTDADGNELAPIAYPYQLISYELKGDVMETWVEQGAGEYLQSIGPGTDIRVTRYDGGTLFSAPLFMQMTLPNGVEYQSYENYDFFEPDEGDSRFITFLRYGDAPPWSGVETAVMHLTTERFDSFDELPESMRDWILENAQLWQFPPEDLADIRRLQQGHDSK